MKLIIFTSYNLGRQGKDGPHKQIFTDSEKCYRYMNNFFNEHISKML